jgi:flagellar biosynthesis protein FlhF
MKIKNFYVADMYDAMIRIKQEMGEDAVIISKRKVKQQGIFGFLKPKIFEVTAAIEENRRTPEEEILTSQKTTVDQGLKNELSELKESVKKLVQDSQEVAPKILEHSDDLDTLFRNMDLNEMVVDDFNSYCNTRGVKDNDANKIDLYEFLMNRFNNKINIKQIDSKVMVLVGPTGVGKTTTIAKIASRESLINHRRVGLITIDTYRIGAVEQFKIYANILDIPLEVVNQKDEMINALENLKDCDLILVDTTGMSYKNYSQLLELKEYIDLIDDKETSLVVSMTSKSSDFGVISEAYQFINYDNFILTKFDETQSYGNILNMLYFSNKPLTYISTGQVVPDDLEFASRETLFNYIWGEV